MADSKTLTIPKVVAMGDLRRGTLQRGHRGDGPQCALSLWLTIALDTTYGRQWP
jgi:hypothetical protein